MCRFVVRFNWWKSRVNVYACAVVQKCMHALAMRLYTHTRTHTHTCACMHMVSDRLSALPSPSQHPLLTNLYLKTHIHTHSFIQLSHKHCTFSSYIYIYVYVYIYIYIYNVFLHFLIDIFGPSCISNVCMHFYIRPKQAKCMLCKINVGQEIHVFEEEREKKKKNLECVLFFWWGRTNSIII